MTVPPQFAVLLKGKWGAGKTWFIQKALERLEKREKSTLYVRLYGITSTSGIDKELFRQIHPVLGSRAAGVVGKVVNSVLKGAFSFDLNGDSTKDISGLSIPGFDLMKAFKASADSVLVFDDLERCLMPIRVVLGYINQFVEHGGHKAIIIANEAQILSKPRRVKHYHAVKEKLIGSPAYNFLPSGA